MSYDEFDKWLCAFILIIFLIGVFLHGHHWRR